MSKPDASGICCSIDGGGLSISPDPLVVMTTATSSDGQGRGGTMNHPIVHAEIRSADPDATRAYFGELFGWTYPNEGAFPGYTFVETGVPGALYTAISPLQGDEDLVTFFVGIDDMAATIEDAVRLGGRVVQAPVTVPGVSFALIADPQGHIVGLAQQLAEAPPS
jgi:predicted enzyme related to lactoylglutathione lyase